VLVLGLLQVQNLLRPLYGEPGGEAGDAVRVAASSGSGGSSGRSGGGGSGKADIGASGEGGGLGLRLDISPLSTMLSGEALERARKSCEDASGKAGAPSTPTVTSTPVVPRVAPKAAASSTDGGGRPGSRGAEGSQTPPASPHGAMLDSLLEKLELGEIPAAGEKEGPRAAPVVVRPTPAPAPLGTAGVASRGYLHRQILHSLFVSEGANHLKGLATEGRAGGGGDGGGSSSDPASNSGRTSR
jgi:hypothetical protein